MDLKSEAGRKVFLTLVKNADIVFEQYRPGTMDKLGLGYEELKKVNESIIYCALTGYGYSGPLEFATGHEIGKEEWIGKNLKRDPEFQQEMKYYISEMFLKKTQKEWVEFFADVDICFTAILDMNEAVEHPQIIDRKVIIKIEDLEGSGRTAYLPGLPVQLSETPGEIITEFAFLGRDSRDILKENGYSDEQIKSLIMEKVIGAGTML